MKYPTNINQDLVAEVLRLKDAAIMFPDQREKKKRILNVMPAVIPASRPSSHLEWWMYIIEAYKEKHTIERQTKTFIEVKRQVLTQEHKDTLKSMSHKSSSAFAVAA